MYLCEKLMDPDDRRLRLCAQMGVGHLLVDNRAAGPLAPGSQSAAWDAQALRRYRAWIEGFGLRLDILALGLGPVLADALVDLDSARRRRALLADNIRRAGDAGIACLTYHPRLAAASRSGWRPGRGGLRHAAFDIAEYGRTAQADGALVPLDEQAAWETLDFLLEGLLPAAEEAGVRLAGHLQDPAFSTGGAGAMRHVAASVDGMRRFLALSPSRHHGLSFCQAAVAGMFKEPAKALAPVAEEFAATGRLFLVKFRNLRGGFQDFHDVLPDEGELDMLQVLKALQRGGYAGPLCPDYRPGSGEDPGGERLAAFSLGYTRGLLQAAGVRG